MRELFIAPWANQAVGPVVRVFAWVFVACSSVAFTAGAYFTAIEGFPTDLPLQALGVMLGTVYITAIFLFVGIKGKAPSGWIPWK